MTPLFRSFSLAQPAPVETPSLGRR